MAVEVGKKLGAKPSKFLKSLEVSQAKALPFSIKLPPPIETCYKYRGDRNRGGWGGSSVH
eukprot:664816-Hanusia_phi.AAC.1